MESLCNSDPNPAGLEDPQIGTCIPPFAVAETKLNSRHVHLGFTRLGFRDLYTSIPKFREPRIP